MRVAGLILCLNVAAIGPAAAFEGAPARATVIQGLQPLPPPTAAASRRTLAAFSIDDRLVTLNAYGRRSRARMNGDIDGLREARAMSKVFSGAPQPALITFELSMKF